MKKLFTITTLCLGLLTWTLPAAAAIDEKDIQKILAKIEKGKGVDEDGAYPDDTTKVFKFSVDGLGDGHYVIDMNAQLCFYYGEKDRTLMFTVPCKNLKSGYPIIAPLISWEE